MPAWPLSLASQLKQKPLYIRLFRSTGSCPAVSQNYPRDLQQGRKSDINTLSSAASTHWCATTATSVRLSRTVRVENHEKTLVAADVPRALAVGAHAQSSATPYGSPLDAASSWRTTWTPATAFGVECLLRFGLRGAEDPGGGLKAIFALESGFNALHDRICSFTRRHPALTDSRAVASSY